MTLCGLDLLHQSSEKMLKLRLNYIGFLLAQLLALYVSQHVIDAVGGTVIRQAKERFCGLQPGRGTCLSQLQHSGKPSTQSASR